MVKHPQKYNRFSFQTKCRVCLTQSTAAGTNLRDPLSTKRPDVKVYEALEAVIKEKVPVTPDYPSTVCGMCMGLLNIAYEFKIQFMNSQSQIREALGKQDDIVVNESEKAAVAPVELVVGDNRYDIKNILIVEEENDETEHEYEGFLNNLGSSITATFANKNSKKKKAIIEPIVNVTKIYDDIIKPSDDFLTNLGSSITGTFVIDKKEPIVDVYNDIIEPSEDLDKYILKREDMEDEDLPGIKPEELNIDSAIKDKDLIKSAMKLVYKCPFCSKPYAALNKLRNHISACGNCKSLKCCICGRNFKERKYLNYHIKNVHLSLKKTENKTKKTAQSLWCNVCNIMCQSRGNYRYHMSKHQGKKYGCEVCGKMFHTKSLVVVHRQSHSKNKILVLCPVCGKGFHYHSGLFYHMKQHTNERNYQCSFCERNFYTMSGLKRHERTHTGDRPYKCLCCDKKFRSLSELKKHDYLHTGERPYRCSYCDCGFTQSYNLNVHLMTHTGDFECPLCNKKLLDMKILKFHLKLKHGVKILDEELLNKQVVVEETNENQDKFIVEMIEEDYQVECSDDEEQIFAERLIDDNICEEELIDSFP